MPLKEAPRQYQDAMFTRQGFWHHWDVEPFTPNEVDRSAVLYSEVNDGRWVVQCPCGGAQLTSPRIPPVFFCVDCLNVAVDGKLIRVVHPSEFQDIETVLSFRPDENTRNWSPGETVPQLVAENLEHGVMI